MHHWAGLHVEADVSPIALGVIVRANQPDLRRQAALLVERVLQILRRVLYRL